MAGNCATERTNFDAANANLNNAAGQVLVWQNTVASLTASLATANTGLMTSLTNFQNAQSNLTAAKAALDACLNGG